jgi:hypothetical protein
VPVSTRAAQLWLGSGLIALGQLACAEGSGSPRPEKEPSPVTPRDAGDLATLGEITYRRDVAPIERVEDALPSTFVPPFEDCRDPIPGQSAQGPGERVCTNVAISGATEEGKRFADYADCAVVRRQRPYWSAPPARASQPDDARLSDATFVRESLWASEQIAATGCSCCHDGRLIAASQWDIALGPLWLDSLSDTGLALFAGLADSSLLGAYPAANNHGFDRDLVGVPSSDPARMKALMLSELSRRGLSEEWARAVPPFGGPIYTASREKPAACAGGQGIDVDGSVRFTDGPARYIYVLTPGSKNPGVPPNLDLPDGTLWRLDVRADHEPLASGVPFGRTPPGTFQVFPESTPALPLTRGETFQLVVLRDVGLSLVNCLFTFGTPVPPVSEDAAAPLALDAGSVYPDRDAAGSTSREAGTSAEACSLVGGDARGFGAPCNDTVQHSDCPCAANYCSKSPFDTQGYCSVIGCKEDPDLCPVGFSCFDVSVFAPGQPSVCARP